MPVSNNNNYWRGRFIRYAPLILWIGVIFFLSSQMGAASNTSRILRPLLLWLFPDITEASLQIAHYTVRKLAHFSEYAVLGLLAALAFKGSSSHFLRRWQFPLAVLLAALVAALDETNQSFNSARTGAVGDVFIDISGALCAALFVFLLGLVWHKRQRQLSSPSD